MKPRSLAVLMVFLAVLGQPARPQQAAKPMTKDQVMSVVTAGMDNAELAKKIEERGIDFDLTDDYLQALRKAGAQEVVIKALRAVKPNPMGRDQLLLLVAGSVPSERVASLVKRRGVDFVPDDKYLESLRTAGADDALIAVVREAKPPEVQRHLVRAAECEQTRAWAETEKEYRAALALAPGNAEFLQKAESAAKHLKPPQYKLVKTFRHTGNYDSCVGSETPISPDGRWAALSDGKGLDIWDVATGEKRPSPPGKDVFAFGPDGRWLAAIAKDFKGVGVWEVATGREVGRLPLPRVYPLSMKFSPDGRRLALGDMDGTVKLWEPVSGKEVLAVTARSDAKAGDVNGLWVYWVAFSPDGRLLALAGDHSTIKLWETATGKEVRALVGFEGAAVSAAFSPDGHLLASSSGDGILWDVSTGQVVRSFDKSLGYGGHVTFTPDGDWLAWSSLDGVTLWEVGTGHKVAHLEGLNHPTVYPVFSADGKWLAATSDTEVYLWQRQD